MSRLVLTIDRYIAEVYFRDPDLQAETLRWVQGLVDWAEGGGHYTLGGYPAIGAYRWEGEGYEIQVYLAEGGRWVIGPDGHLVTEWAVPPIPPPAGLMRHAVAEVVA